MSDGAHVGISAQRAIETIIGGKDEPAPEEQQTPEQVRARIMNAPSPLAGSGPDDYGTAADCIAKAFLVVLAHSPDMAIEGGPLWRACTVRWPGFDDWIHGASGFQVGWAVNVVRWLSNQPPVQNQALMTIDPSTD